MGFKNRIQRQESTGLFLGEGGGPWQNKTWTHLMMSFTGKTGFPWKEALWVGPCKD